MISILPARRSVKPLSVSTHSKITPPFTHDLSCRKPDFRSFHGASPAKTAGRGLLASLPEPARCDERSAASSLGHPVTVPDARKNGPAAGVTLQIHRRGVVW